MAFDWSRVEGYREDMSPEELVGLLANYTEPNYGKLKGQYDTVASQLADAKKQLKARMTEDEQREAERENANKALRDELDTANEKIASLERERALAKYQRSFMEQKYDADASAAMAKALVDGDTEGLLKALGKANEAIVQSAKTELLRNTPLPAAGDKGKEPASDSEVLAKQIGERRAATDKAATDIIAKYI